MWIAPFGHLRIVSCLPIPAAFRSLPRPSSAPDAKAFSLSSYQLKRYSRIMSCSQRISLNLGEVEIVFTHFLKFYFLKFGYFNFLFVVSLFNFQWTFVHPPAFEALEWFLVGWNGLEPSTSRLSAECTNQLSYQPVFRLSIALYLFDINQNHRPLVISRVPNFRKRKFKPAELSARI